MHDDKMPLVQQENVLTVLAHSDKFGQIVADTVSPSLFEGDYQVIAERCVAYWRENNRAPAIHTHDLFADILEAKDNRKAGTFRSIINDMARLSEDINAEYVVRELSKFRRMQMLKESIVQSAERLQQPTPTTIKEVEDILGNILRARDYQLDPGMSLRDLDRLFQYLDKQGKEFNTGIGVFDSKGIGPHRGEVLMFLGGKGRGKSWWLINLGKRALLQRKKVLHVSLEMGEEQCAQRYLQSLFAIPKREAEVMKAVIEVDRDGKFVGIDNEPVDYDFSFESDDLRTELQTRIDLTRNIDNLRIKRFPTRTLTMPGLRAYLDGLSLVEKFEPDLVLLDYIGITATPARKERHLALAENIEDFRAIMIERDAAGATAGQLTREGFESRQATSTHTAEAWAMIHSSDITITHSATREEQRRGLGRLFVDHARSDADKFGCLIVQNYEIGQFVLDSIPLPNDYFEYLASFREADRGKGGKEDDDD